MNIVLYCIVFYVLRSQFPRERRSLPRLGKMIWRSEAT